ncbi:MAG: DUF4238 domain-containing protein [Methylorubrum rhodinum]|uniref:DUF4238 domain-containing protein n=1 Tax=Methylorubrum rhodinum TaxID=29428 RepID=UPI003BB0605D
MANEPRDHHYVPQFFLRNFSIDKSGKKILTVAKNGDFAVWAERSIESIGFERDFYVHMDDGNLVSIENHINRGVENPISKSSTWRKILENKTDMLNEGDKPILYALIRHLEARTPHYLDTGRQLADLAAKKGSEIPFTAEERAMYATLRSDPDLMKKSFNMMSSSLRWAKQTYDESSIIVLRSKIALRTSTAPAMPMKFTGYRSTANLLPGMMPYQLVLTLNPHTIACLLFEKMDNGFMNMEMDDMTAKEINRYFASQFSYFDQIRHLISDRSDLIADMTWAPFEMIKDSGQKIVFRRKAKSDRWHDLKL